MHNDSESRAGFIPVGAPGQAKLWGPQGHENINFYGSEHTAFI